MLLPQPPQLLPLPLPCSSKRKSGPFLLLHAEDLSIQPLLTSGRIRELGLGFGVQGLGVQGLRSDVHGSTCGVTGV